jgi:hypothetical protein
MARDDRGGKRGDGHAVESASLMVEISRTQRTRSPCGRVKTSLRDQWK